MISKPKNADVARQDSWNYQRRFPLFPLTFRLFGIFLLSSHFTAAGQQRFHPQDVLVSGSKRRKFREGSRRLKGGELYFPVFEFPGKDVIVTFPGELRWKQNNNRTWKRYIQGCDLTYQKNLCMKDIFQKHFMYRVMILNTKS